jgi:hypothetical protein
MNVNDNFLNKTKFTQLVQNTVEQFKMSYMDAILHICEENDILPEDVKRFISPVVRDKLEQEAVTLNFLPKTTTITFE